MVDFKRTELQQELVGHAHDFAASVLRPAEQQLDQLADPEEVFSSETFRSVMRQAYELGYHRIAYPKHIGGLGLDPLTVSLIHEELFWGGPGLTQNILVGGFVAHTALMSGRSSLVREFAIPFCEDRSGTVMGCFAGVEAAVGSDLV